MQGLILYATFVFPSVVLGAAMSLFSTAYFRWSRTFFTLMGLFILIASVLFDIGFHPQFYTYNHIFGAVLGPIYDEELSIRPGLFIFRITTLIWAMLLVFWANARHSSKPRMVAHRVAAVIALMVLTLLNVFPGRVGLNATYRTIENELPSVFHTDHFSTHFAVGQYSDQEVAYISALQEFRYEQLESRLDVSVAERIHVYLYPDESTKGRATGSRSTSVTPVWLSKPQIHMLADRHESTFSHELVHVFSREFGLPIIRANPSIGLVEGLAGALEAPDGLPTADAQVAAAFRETSDSEDELAVTAIRTMSPLGFWSGRGAVSYTVANSFTSFLIGEIGIERYKNLYGSFSPRSVLGHDLSNLADQWASELLQNELPDSVSSILAVARFSIPSLFEKSCPHHVSSEERLLRRISERLIEGDTLAAQKLLATPHRNEPMLAYVAASLAMADGAPDKAVRLGSEFDFVGFSLIEADANRMQGRDASSLYDSLLTSLPPYARSLRAAIMVRMAGVVDSSAVELLYGSQERACGRDVGIIEKWVCANYHRETKEFGRAAEALTDVDSSETLPVRLRDEFSAFLLQREANSWLLSGDAAKADAALQRALLTDYVSRYPYVKRLVLDRIEFVRFFRDNNITLSEV